MLVTPPATFESIETIITLLLDDRQLRPQIDFDAVVAVADNAALSTIEVSRIITDLRCI
jgi:hypothetical protein